MQEDSLFRSRVVRSAAAVLLVSLGGTCRLPPAQGPQGPAPPPRVTASASTPVSAHVAAAAAASAAQGQLPPERAVGSTLFVARVSTWKYWVGRTDTTPDAQPASTTGSPPASPRWYDPAFNDTSWGQRSVRPGLPPPTPLPPLGAPSSSTAHAPTPASPAAPATPAPATGAAPSPRPPGGVTIPPAVYYRKRFTVLDREAIKAVVLTVSRGDGARVYLNGVEVARDTRPAGPAPATDSTDASDEPAARSAREARPEGAPATRPAPQPGGGGPRATFVTPSSSPHAFGACLSPDLLLEGDNYLAIEVRRRSATQMDLNFELELLGNDGVSLTRGPYLQVGTPRSAIVRWRTDCPSDTRLFMGPTPDSLGRVLGDDKPTTEHEVIVDALAPDTRYHYALALSEGGRLRRLAGGDPETFFVTPPGKPRPIRAWVLGDSGTKEDRAGAVRDAYRAWAGDRYTDVWLMLGDNAYDRGTDAEYQAAVFDQYPRFLRQSFLWPALGNHETAQAHDLARTRAAPHFEIFTLPTRGEAGGVASGTENYFSFDYGDAHFVCLDSMTTTTEPDRMKRSYPPAMLEWLKADLSATVKPWRIIYFHHPPYTKGTHDSDTITDYESGLLRRSVLPILEAHGADLVLSGHSHVYERTFPLDSHYDKSTTFAPAMKKDSASGRAGEGAAYQKQADAKAHAGVIYIVAGSSGQTDERRPRLNHPAMFISMAKIGSLILDVDATRLDAVFLRDAGFIEDHFTVLKGPLENPLPRIRLTEPVAGATARAGSRVALAAEASDDGRVSRVDFYRSPRRLIARDSDPPFEAELGVPAPGTYQVYAEAVDERGATVMSAPVTVNVAR